MKVSSKYEELSKYYIELCDEKINNIKLRVSVNNNNYNEIKVKVIESNKRIKKLNDIIKTIIN